ncbi:PAPA-1 domain-containing protein [Favolaschia claudopus]|uniref:PAPA-1 domain-containing protein n=1 Tax=Favolaschia claudopus TaxID=2862362 RepID=A0AAW0DKE4_9AGAR
MPVASEESEVDIEVEEMQDSEEEVDDEEEEEDAGEDELEDSDNDPPSIAPSHAGPLKIKLKLGAQPEKPSSRRYARPKNEDIESEDSDSEASYSAAAPNNRQLTARQAVLASHSGPSHVSLDTPSAGSSKKTQYTASEVALRKEENARKRKNMIEKKLEDEKAETINRLLKKQSRPRNKRNAMSDEDVDMEDDDGASTPSGAPPLPSMYRWISTSRRPTPPAEDSKMPVDSTPTTSISFSIPKAFLPSPDQKVVIQLSATTAPSRCAVEGCEKERKYRAVGKEWGVGACGMGHLKLLEGRA